MTRSINPPEGEIVITFTETSVGMTAAGGIKGNWHLELSSDRKAKLPFRKIDRKVLSCEYRGTPYSISATQGEFTNEPGSGLRILPENDRIVLDFSARLSNRPAGVR